MYKFYIKNFLNMVKGRGSAKTTTSTAITPTPAPSTSTSTAPTTATTPAASSSTSIAPTPTITVPTFTSPKTCLTGDITQCKELNEYAKKLNETKTPTNHGNYYVPLNEIITNTTNLNPLLLSSIGNNVDITDFRKRLNNIQNRNPLITSNETVEDVYKNQQDLDDLMTYSNAKLAYCLNLKYPNDNYSIPSIGTGYKNDYSKDEPDKNGNSPLMNSIKKHTITLHDIASKFAANPFKKMNKQNASDNSNYYCNRFMPIYCQNVINYLENKIGTCTQNDLLQFAPQCACFGTTNYEYVANDKKIMELINKTSNSQTLIATLKGNPRKCELAQCSGKYTPDKDDIKCPDNSVQICNVDLNMENSDIEARNNALVNMQNQCNQISANVAMNSNSIDGLGFGVNSGSGSGNNSGLNDNSKSEPAPGIATVIEEAGKGAGVGELDGTKIGEEDTDENPESNNETDIENDTNNSTNTSENKKEEKKEKEKSNTTLYIILAIVAAIVIILIIVIIIISKRKSTSGGALHIADFGHLIKNSKK